MTSSLFNIDDSSRQVRFSPEAIEALLKSQAESTEGVAAFLIMREGKRWAGVHQLQMGAMVTLGRVSSNDVEVQDARCSRRHCAIYDHEGEWFVRDLGSRNGTRVNGEKITGAVHLTSGDTIRIGRAKFVFTNDLAKAVSEPNDEAEDDSSSDDS
jgi:Nif-specific regulatory protein